MSNIDTSKIERLSGWVNFRYKLVPFVIIGGVAFLALAIVRGQGSILNIVLLTVLGYIILAIILYVIYRLYNSAVNLDTNQVRLGKKVFNLSEIDSATIAVDTNILGQKAVSIMLKSGPARGKVLLTQPFGQPTTAASLMYFDAAITRMAIPDDFVGETITRNRGRSLRGLAGKNQIREIIWELIKQKTS